MRACARHIRGGRSACSFSEITDNGLKMCLQPPDLEGDRTSRRSVFQELGFLFALPLGIGEFHMNPSLTLYKTCFNVRNWENACSDWAFVERCLSGSFMIGVLLGTKVEWWRVMCDRRDRDCDELKPMLDELMKLGDHYPVGALSTPSLFVFARRLPEPRVSQLLVDGLVALRRVCMLAALLQNTPCAPAIANCTVPCSSIKKRRLLYTWEKFSDADWERLCQGEFYAPHGKWVRREKHESMYKAVKTFIELNTNCLPHLHYEEGRELFEILAGRRQRRRVGNAAKKTLGGL